MASAALRIGPWAQGVVRTVNGPAAVAIGGESRGFAAPNRPPRVSGRTETSGSTSSSLVGLARDARELLATVAHELRAPLASVAVSSELLVEDVETLDLDRIRRMASTIHSSTLWLQQLLENLLCAATIDEGHFRLQPGPVDLADVLAEVCVVVDPLLAAKRQRLLLTVLDRKLAISADPRRIAQVLVNLLSNASKFAPPRTTIELGCATRGDAVRISVADRGSGIQLAAREQLFAPFSRGAEAERSGVDGVGLGLAIVKSIVEAHGGRVGADNRRGGGARFWFELPLSDTRSAGADGGMEKERD